MNMKRNGKGNSKTPALCGLELMPRCTRQQSAGNRILRGESNQRDGNA